MMMPTHPSATPRDPWPRFGSWISFGSWMTWNFGGFFAMGCEKWVRWVRWIGLLCGSGAQWAWLSHICCTARLSHRYLCVSGWVVQWFSGWVVLPDKSISTGRKWFFELIVLVVMGVCGYAERMLFCGFRMSH